MQTTSKQTSAPAQSTTIEVASTSTAPRVLSTAELTATTGGAKPGVMVGSRAGTLMTD